MIDLVARVAPTIKAPLVLFTYYNPIYQRGFEAFVKEIADALNTCATFAVCWSNCHPCNTWSKGLTNLQCYHYHCINNSQYTPIAINQEDYVSFII